MVQLGGAGGAGGATTVVAEVPGVDELPGVDAVATDAVWAAGATFAEVPIGISCRVRTLK